MLKEVDWAHRSRHVICYEKLIKTLPLRYGCVNTADALIEASVKVLRYVGPTNWGNNKADR